MDKYLACTTYEKWLWPALVLSDTVAQRAGSSEQPARIEATDVQAERERRARARGVANAIVMKGRYTNNKHGARRPHKPARRARTSTHSYKRTTYVCTACGPG